MEQALIFEAFCRLIFIIDELCLHKFSNAQKALKRLGITRKKDNTL